MALASLEDEPDDLPDDLVDADDVLRWATDAFPRITLATSLGPQSIVILHLLQRLGRPVRTLLLDTGLLFDETLAFAKTVEAHFGIAIERVRPTQTPLEQARTNGAALFRLDPDRCCHLRKVVPLRRALEGQQAWITGLRRDQSASRATVEPLAWDAAHDIVKVSPLAFWTRNEVLSRIKSHNLPHHPLLTQGFTSLGCRTCTRRPLDPNDERSGRWHHSRKTECGIHRSPTPVRELKP
ncbi:MAG: phosphoadenylyl-sulfate reductase [Myxococcota bacterium]